MRGGRDERDDECSLGFDSRKDDLDGCYAEAGCCFDRGIDWAVWVRSGDIMKEVCFACNCRGVTKCMRAFY